MTTSPTLQPHHEAVREIERQEDQAQQTLVQRERLEQLRQRFGIEPPTVGTAVLARRWGPGSESEPESGLAGTALGVYLHPHRAEAGWPFGGPVESD